MSTSRTATTLIVASRFRETTRWVLLAVALACLAWAGAVAISGGVVIRTGWLRLSSRDPLRPLLLAVLMGGAYAVAAGRRMRDDARLGLRPQSIAAALVVATAIVGVHFGSFVAAGADASGYVSQAAMWQRGKLTVTAPDWAQSGTWDGAAWSSAPLGYRSSEISYILVPTYSPGLPMMMAALDTIVGQGAGFYAVPVLGAAAVWAAYLLGARFTTPWAGVVGAALLLASPTFLLMLVQPLSDVPVTGLWGLALWAAAASTRRRATLAGVITALAILTRPNLVPLTAVVLAVVLLAHPRRLQRGALFVAATIPAALTVAALNDHWYGSPLRSGYGSLGVIFAADRVWPNLLNYATWFIRSETPVGLLALAAPAVVRMRGADTRLLRVAGLLFPLGVLLLYLPYFVFEVWWYLRFLLPAFPPLFAAAGAAIVSASHQWRVLRLAAPIGIGVLLIHGVTYSNAFSLQQSDGRYLRVAEYAAGTPPRSVFVSLLHSGSIHHYAGRDVLRWELVAPDALDGALAHIRGEGYRVYVAADRGEVEEFARRFAGTAAAAALMAAPVTDLDGALVFDLDW